MIWDRMRGEDGDEVGCWCWQSFFLAALFLPGGSLAPASAARMRVCDGSDQAPPATPHAVDRRRSVPATEVLRRLR